MYQRLFLVAALLSRCSGESAVRDQPESVLAFAGADVILPCSINVPDNGDFPDVEWSKERLVPNVVLLYRNGCETPEEKNQAFRYRTSLLTMELNSGNISLRISNVQLSDAGTYRCMRLWGSGTRDTTTVELAVAAVSDPELSVTSEGGGVAALCEAHCWLPEPQVVFLDQNGNELPADEPRRDRDARGCFTVRRRAALHHVPNRITCRVQQTQINHTRETEIHIPVDRKWCVLSAALSAAGTFLLLSIPASAFCLWRRFRKTPARQQLPVTRQLSEGSTGSGSSSENQLLLRNIQPEGSKVVIDMLSVQVSDLQTKLRKKDELIHQLQNHNKPRSGPQACSPAARPDAPEPGNVPKFKKRNPGILRQNSNPSPERPIRTIHRNHSSPALLDLPVPTPEKKPGRVLRSMSAAHVRPDRNDTIQRRHSSAFPLPAPHNLNKRLDALSEETEVLIPNL